MLEIDIAEIEGVIKNLNQKIDDYEYHVSELSSLSKKIESSTDWINKTVKPSFISYINSYIEIYKTIAKSLKTYTTYLQNKLDNFKENESKFS